MADVILDTLRLLESSDDIPLARFEGSDGEDLVLSKIRVAQDLGNCLCGPGQRCPGEAVGAVVPYLGGVLGGVEADEVRGEIDTPVIDQDSLNKDWASGTYQSSHMPVATQVQERPCGSLVFR